MTITVFKYGSSRFGENYIFRGGNAAVLRPISFVFYLIETADRRILVDVGCNDGAGFVMDMFQTPVASLQTYGLTPDDITDVVITHAHHDHIEAIGAYTQARIYLHAAELSAALPYLSAAKEVTTFKEELTLCDGVTIRPIGGHTAGSSVVLCRAAEGMYVLCGDECYVKACFEERIPTGSSCNPQISEQFIETYGKPPYIPLLFHDPTILDGRLGFAQITK